MPEAARNVADASVASSQRQEYWKPIEVSRHATATDACSTCGTDYPIGARFCYVCGSERATGEAAPRSVFGSKLGRMLDLAELKAAMGLGVGSLIAFFVGIICVIAAGAVGFIYTATTMLDWQAVQIWRMEWLMAAIAAFAAGTLLKR